LGNFNSLIKKLFNKKMHLLS